MRRSLIALAISLFFAFPVLANQELDLDKMFFDANNFYQDGDYLEAAENYEKILSTGIRSGAVYYNLGNAYFKQGALGKALLNYERAKRFIPRDEDLFANMQLTQSMLVEKQPQVEQIWYIELFMKLRDSFSGNAWFVITVFFFSLFLVSLAVMASFESLRVYFIKNVVYGLIILSISTVFLVSRVIDEKRNIPAMVVANEAVVRYSPTYSGSVVFKLHEGVKGQIISEQGDWTQIRLSKGKMGWVESHLIERI